MTHIRKARSDDSTGLARVQVDSYRNTYMGLLPEDYLAHFTCEEQERDWRGWPSSHPDDILYVAEDDRGEIVGYALGRPGLTPIAPYDSELLALHVRRSCHRQGIGQQLVTTVAQQLRRQGCSSLMLWVLEKNPSRQFYMRLGAQIIGQQTVELGEGVSTIEVAYGWPDIDRLCGSPRFAINRTLLASARDRLSRHPALYWVVGGAGSGKTTACQVLSARLGIRLYDMDARIYGEYHRRFDPQRHPVNTAWATAPNGLAWLLAMSWGEFNRFNQAALPEYLDLLSKDLDALEPDVGVLIDGGISNPGLLAQAIPARQIACLAAPGRSSIQVWEGDEERKGMKEAVYQLPNPAQAWHRFLEFDRRLTATLLDECEQSGIPVYVRENTTSVEDLAWRVARGWGRQCP